jgi:hypothetical protein
MWLRILEVSAGLIILILGVAAFYPGTTWGWKTFIAFLAVALIVLEIAYIIRVFAKGISGRRRLNLILSVLATLIAVLVLALTYYGPYYGSYYESYIVFYGVPINFVLILLNLLALGLLFAGIASAVRGTVGGKIVGTFGIFVGIFVLILLHIEGAFFLGIALLIRPGFSWHDDVGAVITLSLAIFGVEPIISGILGRWI